MPKLKFEIIVESPPAIHHLFDVLKPIIEHRDFIKIKITKVEEEEE